MRAILCNKSCRKYCVLSNAVTMVNANKKNSCQIAHSDPILNHFFFFFYFHSYLCGLFNTNLNTIICSNKDNDLTTFMKNKNIYLNLLLKCQNQSNMISTNTRRQ